VRRRRRLAVSSLFSKHEQRPARWTARKKESKQDPRPLVRTRECINCILMIVVGDGSSSSSNLLQVAKDSHCEMILLELVNTTTRNTGQRHGAAPRSSTTTAPFSRAEEPGRGSRPCPTKGPLAFLDETKRYYRLFRASTILAARFRALGTGACGGGDGGGCRCFNIYVVSRTRCSLFITKKEGEARNVWPIRCQFPHAMCE
jgi:hypothetical protein